MAGCKGTMNRGGERAGPSAWNSCSLTTLAHESPAPGQKPVSQAWCTPERGSRPPLKATLTVALC